jgi:hypothetical protein
VFCVGVTVVEPEAGCEPLIPVIVTDVAFCVTQASVACCPDEMLAGEAVKLVTTGAALPVGVLDDDECEPPQETIPKTETAPTNSAVHNFQGPV